MYQDGTAGSIRKRKHKDEIPTSGAVEDVIKETGSAATDTLFEGTNVKEGVLTTHSFWLTRIIFIRALGFIYCEYILASLHVQ